MAGVVGLVAAVLSATVVTGVAQAASPSPAGDLRQRAAAMLSGGDPKLAKTLESTMSCWVDVTIRSSGNGRYVKADFGVVGAKGLLRAATAQSAIGEWEKFGVCRDPSDWRTVMFSQYNGLPYVSTELGGDYQGVRRGLLRARNYDYTPGSWENFSTISQPANNGPLGAGNSTWFYSWAAGLYVSAQLDYPDWSLRARLGSVGPWESFTWSGTPI